MFSITMLYIVYVYCPLCPRFEEFSVRVEAPTEELAKKKVIGKTVTCKRAGHSFEVEEQFITRIYPAKTITPPPYKLMPEEKVKEAKWLRGSVVDEPLPLGAKPKGSPKLATVIKNALTTIIYSQPVESKAIQFLKSHVETRCRDCKYVTPHRVDKCPRCGSANVEVKTYSPGDIIHYKPLKRAETLVEEKKARWAYPHPEFEWRICYDRETELLTRDGFKKFKNIAFEDEIATLNPSTDRIEYCKPVTVHRYRYKGRMVHFQGKCYDLKVTPDHLVYCRLYPYYKYKRLSGRRKFKFMRAIELYNKYCDGKFQFKRDAKWDCEDVTYFQLPRIRNFTLEEMKNLRLQALKLHENGFGSYRISQKLKAPIGSVNLWIYKGKKPKLWDLDKIPINAWLRFFGWWITEGWLNNRGYKYDVYIGQSSEKHLEYLHEIANTVREIGLHPCVAYGEKSQVTIMNKQLFMYLQQFGKAKDKYIPKWIKNLPPRRLKILFETMMKGDGGRNGKLYATMSKKLADDFQEILLKIGLSGSVSRTKKGLYLITVARKKLTPVLYKTPKVVDYDGFVYDVTVPRNHVLLVRRNGKICWSSNSYPRHVFTKFYEQAKRMSQAGKICDAAFYLICYSPGITIRMIADILMRGYWVIYRCIAPLVSAEQLRKLGAEVEEQSKLEKWMPKEFEETIRRIELEKTVPKLPKVVLGPKWRGQYTCYPFEHKTEDELLAELKRILTLEGYPVLTPEEEEEMRAQLRRHREERLKESIMYYLGKE